jgi:hypothetical protein
MAKQRIGPGEGLVEPESRRKDGITEGEDVEGHGLPTTAPPGIAHRSPGHGGENIPNPDDEDDVEGHKRK